MAVKSIDVQAESMEQMLEIRSELIKVFGDRFDFDKRHILSLSNDYFITSWPERLTNEVQDAVKEISKNFPNNRFTVVTVDCDEAIEEDHDVIYNGRTKFVYRQWNR